MKKIVLAAALLAALALACKAPAPTSSPAGGTGAKPNKVNPVVVTVDMDRLMGDSSLAKGLHAELKSWAEGVQGELRARAESIRAAETSRSKPAAEIESMKQQLFQMQEAAKQEFQKRQMGAAERMNKSFAPLIQTLAKENGWDVVLNKNEQVAIYTGEALDQTDFILSRLNTAPAPKAEAPAPEAKP